MKKSYVNAVKTGADTKEIEVSAGAILTDVRDTVINAESAVSLKAYYASFRNEEAVASIQEAVKQLVEAKNNQWRAITIPEKQNVLKSALLSTAKYSNNPVFKVRTDIVGKAEMQAEQERVQAAATEALNAIDNAIKLSIRSQKRVLAVG